MKAFLTLLVLLESTTLIKATPVLPEHSNSLVENQGTHVRGYLNGGGRYSFSSRDPPHEYNPELVKPIKPLLVRIPRKEAIDTTLTEWIPPVKRPRESAKAYRARYLKSQSNDRVNREAKNVVLQHIPDQKQASKIYLEFTKAERDRSLENYARNQKLRSAGLLKQVTHDPDEILEKKRATHRKKWRQYGDKYRLRAKLKKIQGPLDEELVKKAKALGVDPETIHEPIKNGRKSEVKNRVHAYLLEHGHVTEEALKASEEEAAKISHDATSSAPNVAKADFINDVQRKPRTKKAKTNAIIGQASSPSTPPGSEMQQRTGGSSSSSSEESYSGGSPFPRKKRTKTFVVPKEHHDDNQAALQRTEHPMGRIRDPLLSSLKPIPHNTRTKVVQKRKRIQDTFRDIFGEI